MREKIAHTLLVIFVVTLAVSSMLLADKVSELKEQIPVLASKISFYESSARTTTVLQKPFISQLSPNFGNVGARVKIIGSGFAKAGNTIFFNYHEIKAGSPDGYTLYFTVPDYITYPCYPVKACPTNDWQAVVPGQYTVAVSNGSQKSNGEIFIVTEKVKTSSSVRLNTIKPNSGGVGFSVTLTGTGFNRIGNTVVFGYHEIKNLPSNGAIIKFQVPKELVYSCQKGEPCPTSAVRATAPGNYPVYVKNSKGASNQLIFAVTPMR